MLQREVKLEGVVAFGLPLPGVVADGAPPELLLRSPDTAALSPSEAREAASEASGHRRSGRQVKDRDMVEP